MRFNKHIDKALLIAQRILRFDVRVSKYRIVDVHTNIVFDGPFRAYYDIRDASGVVVTHAVDSLFGHVWTHSDGSDVGYGDTGLLGNQCGATARARADEAEWALKERNETAARKVMLDGIATDPKDEVT